MESRTVNKREGEMRKTESAKDQLLRLMGELYVALWREDWETAMALRPMIRTLRRIVYGRA